MKTNKLTQLILVIITSIIVVLLLFRNTTNTLKLVEYSIESARLPSSFNGFKIVQISDLHCIKSSKQSDKLLNLINQANPNIIVFTGDIIDESSNDYSLTYTFLESVTSIAPTYAVNGNHEAWLASDTYQAFEEKLNELGILLLHNQAIKLIKTNETINLFGVDDPDFIDRSDTYASEIMNHQLKDIPSDCFTLLLTHRPELFACYANKNIDVILSGHAHGGQIRFPIIGAIIAPNQPLFPPYTKGKYTKDNSTMIVSSGIDTSKIPLRINNPGEVVVITLNQK